MKHLFALVLLVGCPLGAWAQATFTNPLLPGGPDPWVIARDGYYYYMHTTGTNLTLWKTRDITDLIHAEKKIVWTAPSSGPYSHDIWAPELHWLEGKWYLYFAAADEHGFHRNWVLENPSPDPLQGDWTMKGSVADTEDKWSIDPTVLSDSGKNYFIWSESENDVQSIKIALLATPWKIEGTGVRLSLPVYSWEKVGDLSGDSHSIRLHPHVDVNEGPEILQHGDKIFLIYSASGCWTNYYALGQLTAISGSNLLDPASWKKSAEPVFWQSPEAGVYGPGHNTFFKSPDGTQDWILYHANSHSNDGCGDKRSPRAQLIQWNADGSPSFGRPIAAGTPISKPSGTPLTSAP